MPTLRSDELRALADAINSNANAARTVVVLLLLLALYLFLTLVASTDRNLLFDGQVVLPQLGVGLSVSISYALAPPIFLYLHLHGMLVLATLARQMRTYDTLVRAGGGEQPQPNQSTRSQETAPAWNLLSAFPFIQMYVPNSGTALPSKMLVWLTVVIIPPLLLAAIDLSFLRYQSWTITLFHHFVLLFDILVVQIFVMRFRWGLARRSATRQLEVVLVRYLRRIVTVSRARRACSFMKHVRYAPSVGILLLFVAYAHPPSFNLATLDDDRARMWGNAGLGFWGSALSGHNILDAGPCKWWGLACRYLDVREGQPVEFDGSSVSDTASASEGVHGVQGADLSKRDFRFARLHSVRLIEANLRRVDLRGAELDRSVFRRADLSDADLTGAQLRQADLQGANLLRAKFNAVDLYEAELRGAQMTTAEFMGANLHKAQLAGAEMDLACLAGSSLMSAGLQGANLSGAYLQGAELLGAKLHGANLARAQLHAVNFGLTILDGANLSKANLEFTFGTPASLYLTVLDDVTFHSGTEKTSTDYRGNTLCPVNLWTLKPASGSSTTIEQEIKQRLNHANMQKWRAQVWRLIRNRTNPTDSGSTARIVGGQYWHNLREWTVEFACRNRFTALSTLRRWNYIDAMDNVPVPPSEWRLMRKKLASHRRSASDCLGLVTLPESLWESFLLDWD